MPRVAKQTFATICSALADAKAGDTVHVSTSSGVEPTAYTVTGTTIVTDRISTIDLLGRRRAKRRLVVAAAVNGVLLCKGTHARMVVQAWVEPAAGAKAKPTEVEQLRAELYDTNAQLVAARAELRNRTHAFDHGVGPAALERLANATGVELDDGGIATSASSPWLRTSADLFNDLIQRIEGMVAERLRMSVYIDALRDVSPDVWQLTGDDLDDSATLAVAVARLVHDKRALDKAHAELGRKLDAVETQRDGMSRALCQLRKLGIRSAGAAGAHELRFRDQWFGPQGAAVDFDSHPGGAMSIQSKQRSCPRSRTAIMTVSGRYWDAMDPRPEWVHMPDVAHGLEIPRFNNQTSAPITVASHLIRAARMFVALESRFTVWITGQGLSRYEVELAILIHDAAEGYIGDRLGPLKTEADSTMEAGTLAAIVRHLIIHDDARAERVTALALTCPMVRWIDRLACAHEALLWQPHSQGWAMPAGVGDGLDLDPGMPITLDVLALTIPCVMPRPGDNWLTSIRRAVDRVDRADYEIPING